MGSPRLLESAGKVKAGRVKILKPRKNTGGSSIYFELALLRGVAGGMGSVAC